MNKKAEYYISKLQLKPHPEGGYFKEVYRSGEIFEAEHLPGRYIGNRAFSTSIYFLLEGGQVSNFHRIKSDELWHFYDGSAVKIYVIEEDGVMRYTSLGSNLEEGEALQAVIKKNSWFAAELKDKNSFSLIGCTVSPGFDFDDFELGSRESLLKQFPDYSEVIKKLTKFTH